MADLAAVTTPVPIDPDNPASESLWDVPDTWQQGRGAWGGLVVAALARTALAAEPDPDRRLRSISVQMLAPVTVGACRLSSSRLRMSTNLSSRSVRLERDGVLLAHAIAVFGAPRVLQDLDTSGPAWRIPAPSVPAYGEVPVATFPPGTAPVFTQHLQMRPVAGLPGSGAAEVLTWVQLTDPPGSAPYDDITVVALVDALWPAMLPLVPAMRPLATVTFEASVVSDPAALDPEEPLLHRGRVIAARDGYVVESRELWSPAGELVVTNVQTVAVIR